MSTPIQSLTTLPRDINTILTNNLSFNDLLSLCVTGGTINKSVCNDPVMISRLKYEGIPIDRYNTYQGSPIQKYVQTVVNSRILYGTIYDNAVYRYLDIAKFIARAKIIFPGYEYVIGLNKAFKYAIIHHDYNFIEYLLLLGPGNDILRNVYLWIYQYNLELLNEILNVVQDTFNQQYTALPIVGGYGMVVTPVIIQSTVPYYESDNPRENVKNLLIRLFTRLNETGERLIYSRVISPHPFTYISVSYVDGYKGIIQDSDTNIINYDTVIGLIDGHHIEIFLEIIEKYINGEIFIPENNFATNMGNFIDRIMEYGTVGMLKPLTQYIDRNIFNYIFKLTIHNQVDMTKYLFTILQYKEYYIPEYVPRSIEMLDILKKHNIPISNSSIIRGALESNDLQLLDFGLKNIELDKVSENVVYIPTTASPFMITQYIMKVLSKIINGGNYIITLYHASKDNLNLYLVNYCVDRFKDIPIQQLNEVVQKSLIPNLSELPALQKIVETV